MKRMSLIKGVTASITYVVFCIVALPHVVQACATNQTYAPAGVASQCTCSGIAWGSASCGKYFQPYGSYTVCVGATNGSTSCTTPTQFDYYDTGPCGGSVSSGGLTLCIATVILTEGLAALGVAGGCVTPAGFISLGGSCLAALAGVAAADAASIAACAYCQTHSCPNPSQTQITQNWVSQNSATGSACPPKS